MRGSVRLGMLAAGALLVVWVGGAILAWRDELTVTTGPWIAMFVSFGVAGILLILRRPHHVVGWLMLTYGFLSSVGTVGVLLASRLIAGGAPESGAWWDAIGNAVMTAAILAVPAVLTLFPDGVIPPKYGRPLLWFIGLVALVGAAATVFNGGWGGDPQQALAPSPLRSSTAPLGDVLAQLFYAGLSLSVIGASASLVNRWRRSRDLQRQQIKWLALSASLVALALLASGFRVSGQWEIVVMAAAISSIPAAIVLAVFRYRLYDIDRLISRTVSYAVVAGLLGLVFLSLVTSLTLLLPSNDPLVVAVATLGVFALSNPLRRRVQHFVDRRFNRSPYDAERVVEEFAGSLQDRVDPERVIESWVGVVKDTMKPEAVGVWLKDRS